MQLIWLERVQRKESCTCDFLILKYSYMFKSADAATLLVEFAQLFYDNNTFLLQEFFTLLETVVYPLIMLLLCSETLYLHKIIPEQCL